MSTGDQQPPAHGDGNPYQQPGYQSANPYQQPTMPLGAYPGTPPGATHGASPGSDGDAKSGGRRNHGLKMGLAIAASVLMVSATTYGGIQWVGDSDPAPATAAGGEDGDNGDDTDGDDTDQQDPDGTGGENDTDDTDGEDEGGANDPRSPEEIAVEPVVDGWQTQVEVERNIAWDVPEEWRLLPEGDSVAWEVPGEEEDDDVTFFPVMTAGIYLEDYCGANTSRALAGTTGELGAVSTEEAAENSAFQYALAAYDHDQAGEQTNTGAEPFSNDHGFEGHIARSTVEDFPLDEDMDPECAPPSGEAIVVSYVEPGGDLLSWLLVKDTGVDEELDEDTIDQILGSLRPISSAAGDEG